jgi:hypothetical protein
LRQAGIHHKKISHHAPRALLEHHPAATGDGSSLRILELDDDPCRAGFVTVEEQPQRPSADRSDQQIRASIPVKIGRHHGSRITVDVSARRKRAVQEWFSMTPVQEKTVSLVGTQVVPIAGH